MFNGQLRSNEIFASIFNMIISQDIQSNMTGTFYSGLVNKARVDGSLYGDTKLYYATDVLKSEKWGADEEATNLLATHRPEDPKCQPITLDVFRQISLTLDNYLSKRAWSDEGSFARFTGVMSEWMNKTKEVYDTTTYNAFIGTHVTKTGLQYREIELPTSTDAEAQNRLQAGAIAEELANIVVDLHDALRLYNNYGHLESFNDSDLMFVWNAKYVNKIQKRDLPTTFHKDFVEHLGEDTLPSRYFGDILDKSTTTADGSTIRSLIEQDVKLASAYTDIKGDSYKAGELYHVFAGDVIPSGVVIANTSGIIYPAYKVNDKVICKIIHKSAVPYMSAFEVATSFFNAKALLENRYLTFGRNTLEQLDDKPFVTIVAK